MTEKDEVIVLPSNNEVLEVEKTDDGIIVEDVGNKESAEILEESKKDVDAGWMG